METDLTATQHEMRMQGARFTTTGLIFEDNANADVVMRSGWAISLMRKIVDWGEADWLRKMVQLQQSRTQRKRKREIQNDQIEMAIISEYAQLNGRDSSELQQRNKIGYFFPPEMRREGLTFEHHAEAWAHAGGDVAKAYDWLSTGLERNYSVGQLRAHIRRESRRAIEGNSGSTIEVDEVEIDTQLSDMELSAARRLRMVLVYDQSRARSELSALRNTCELIDALRERAETPTPAKESLGDTAGRR